MHIRGVVANIGEGEAMGTAFNGKRTRQKRHDRRRVSITWLLLAVVTVAALAVGACALFLPDRPPELLSPARQVTSAPVNTQEYTGSQQVTVVPTVSASRQLLGNATGTVTADWSGSGLTSGRAAYQVNGRAVVALNTAIPLYRDIRPGDVGQDALAVNNELNRLGYSSSPDSTTFTWYTQLGWQQLMIDQGNDSDGTLLLADTLWIPSPSVTVANWSGTVGAMVSAGAPVGEIPGTITRLDIKNGQPSAQDRTLTMYGQSITLPANATGVDDAAFCAQVTATPEFQQMLQGSVNGTIDLSAGLDASLTLVTPITALRVPAAAVIDAGDGVNGCIVAEDGQTIPVAIVGAELGASLVQPTDGTDAVSIGTVKIGPAIAGASCS